jgi:hypothetical protein
MGTLARVREAATTAIAQAIRDCGGAHVARHEPSAAVLASTLLAEWEANAPLREAMAIKGERWRVKRAEERRVAAARAAKQRSLDGDVRFGGVSAA